MNTIVRTANQRLPSVVSRSNASARQSQGSASTEDTRKHTNSLVALDDSELDNQFSQYSDEELQTLATDIDPWETPGGGLGADERIDFFNRLTSALSPANRQRLQQVLSEGLGKEFASSLERSTASSSKLDTDTGNAWRAAVLSSGSESSPAESYVLKAGNGSDASDVQSDSTVTANDESYAPTDASDVAPNSENPAGTSSERAYPRNVRTQAGDSTELLSTLATTYERNMTLIKGIPDITTNQFDLNRLAAGMTNVDADAQRVEAGTLEWKELADTIVATNLAFREVTGSNLIGSSSKGQIIVTYHTRFPSAMGIDSSPNTYNGRYYGESGWQIRRGLSSTYSGEALNYADKLTSALWSRSTARDLEFVETLETDTFTDYSEFRSAGAQNVASGSPMDFSAVPQPGQASNVDYLLQAQRQIGELAVEAEDSERGQRNLAYANYTLASNILGVPASGPVYAIYQGDAKYDAMSGDLRSVAAMMSATEMGGLGFKTTRRVTDDDGGDARDIKLGQYGNFGKEKYEWAQAFLQSSREQRLEYLGIDSDAWSMAEQYIHAGKNADYIARQLEKEDDTFRTVVISTISAGAVVAGFIFPPASAGAGFLATAAAAGAAAAFTTVGVVFGMTGDLQSAMKAGASSFLSAGVLKFAGQFTGKSGIVADAFSRGVLNELNGEDFVDGVMSSVLEHYGAELGASATSRLQDIAPQFVADLSGKLVESAILNKGKLDNFDDILRQYILDYASGNVETQLTSAFGEDSGQYYGQIFEGLGSAVIAGGEKGLSDYLSSNAFLGALGEGISVDVLEYFGGEESFKAQILSQLAKASIVSGGDPDRLASSVMTIGQGLLGQYASAFVSDSLSRLPEGQQPYVDSLAGLMEVGITSGWDQSTMQGYAFGPLLETLAGSGQDDGAGEFLVNSIAMLAESYERHDGNMSAVAGDIAFFVTERLANAAAEDGEQPEVVDSEVADAENIEGNPDTDNIATVEDALAAINSVLDGSWAEANPDPDTLDPREPVVLAGNGPANAIGLAFRRTDEELEVIVDAMKSQGPVQQRQVIENLKSEGNIGALVDLLERSDPSELEPVLKALSENLSGEQLTVIFQGMSDDLRTAYIRVIDQNGSEQAKQAKLELVDRVQRDALSTSLDTSKVHGKDVELLLDAGQLSLDILGIFDPTPISDGANAVISMLRGNWFDAGISLVSIVPVVGDLAKAGRLGKVAQLGEALTSRYAGMSAEAIASTALGKAIIPVLNTISGVIDNAQSAIGGAAWNRLDPATQEKLQDLKTKIDNMLGGAGAPPVRPLPAPSAHNRASLDAVRPPWSESRIQRELVLRNTQFKAVHEVDSWVKGHNSTVDEYFRTEFPNTHPGVNIEHAKGNYGEMSADLKFTEQLGYVPLATGKARVSSFDQPQLQGIDGLYQKPDGSYLVVEVKPNDGVTSTLTGGERQMSNAWLTERITANFPGGRRILREVLAGERLLVGYDSNGLGQLTKRDLDENGIATSAQQRL